ncbi:uncharacterized protein LOC132179986 isoform X3 [Corylus avellana]|uniref:uncharacterized protein LOC132179986 isoform X3 n=1 Tax=Corylus avellana TaxID=13451 RepID=UPI00286B0904|nr:uncharacterized protein LOC132179986 isoform X3 [Corylus avellana]
MALSRPLLPKPGLQLHLRKIGQSSKRWCSSSSPLSSGGTEQSSHPKEAAREQRAVATEPDVKKNMEMQPGLLPKATQLRNRVGGSWNAMKRIFTNLKVKMLWNQVTSETSDSAADKPALKVPIPQNSSRNTEFGEPESKLQTSETIVDSKISKERISTSVESHLIGESSSRDVADATASETNNTSSWPTRTEPGDPESIVRSSGAISGLSHMRGEIASEDLVNMTAPEVSKVHISPNNFKLSETGSAVQSSEAFTDSQVYEKNYSVNASSNKMRENSSGDQAEGELENGHRLLEGLSSILGDINQNSEPEHLTCSHLLPDEASRTLQKNGADGVTFGDRSRQHDKKSATFVQIPDANSDLGEVDTSNGAPKVTGLPHLFIKMKNGQSAGEMPCKQSNFLTPNAFSEYSDETLGEDGPKGFDIKGLIDCIKELPRDRSVVKSHDSSICSNTKQVSSRGLVKRTEPGVDLQDCDAKNRRALLKSHVMGKESKMLNETEEVPCMDIPFGTHSELCEDEQDGSVDFAASNDTASNPIPLVPVLANTEDLDNIPATDSTKERSIENKVLVRFLMTKLDNTYIMSAFKDCGSIAKIQKLPSVQGSIFEDAYVHFKTRKALQKALKKTDLMVNYEDVIVEATSFMEDAPTRIPIPELIGDPDVPAALIRNPIRTAKIKQLTHDISSCQLQEALAFCKSGISSFSLGSSNSVAYVEFETEDAKERAIAKHSICVSGKKLLVFRIDAPRTTVVRISNINGTNPRMETICNSFGVVKNVLKRHEGTVDVHFKLCEWPNMLSILNSLNGKVVDGHQWVAQPAPVFPPEVLQALWSQPDGRKHVIAAIHSLLQNLGGPIDMVELTDLTARYYGDGQTD